MRIFIGFVERQPLAYHVCRSSIERHAGARVQVEPLRLKWLPIRRRGLTDFTFSRYLCPYLCGYEGEHDMPEDWRVYAWSAGEGFGAQAKERSGNGKRERVWFSPACLDEEQPTLFANQCGSNTTTTQGA